MPNVLAQGVQAVQQRPPAIGLGIRGSEQTAPGMVAIVDHQRLAGVADHEPVDAFRLRGAPDMVGHLLQHRAAGGGNLLRFERAPGAEGFQVLLQLRQGRITFVQHRRAKAGQQRVRVLTAQVGRGIVRGYGAAKVVVVVLERRHARHPARRVDGFAAADGAQVGAWHGEGQAALGDGDARQGHDLHVQPTQPEVRIVIEHACQRNRLNWGKEVPIVVVDDVGVALAKVLERIGEDRPLAGRRIDRNAALRRHGCAGGMVAEEVGAGQRPDGGRQLVQVIEPLACAGIDDQRALRPDNGVDVAAIRIEIHIG